MALQADAPPGPASGPDALTLALRSEAAALPLAQQALQQWLAPHQPSPRASFGLELVLEELLMNQILHAHPGATEPASLSLQARVVGEALVLQLVDRGIAFDPLTRPAPVAPASLDDARPGGLGLHLLRRYTRSMAYARVADENHLTVELALR